MKTHNSKKYKHKHKYPAKPSYSPPPNDWESAALALKLFGAGVFTILIMASVVALGRALGW